MRDLQVFESLRARLEALGKMLHEVLLAGADEVEHEGLALGQPVANVAAELHGDADHRRLEAGLHHPAREHAGRSRASADGENKNAAGNVPECGVVGGCLTHVWALTVLYSLSLAHRS